MLAHCLYKSKHFDRWLRYSDLIGMRGLFLILALAARTFAASVSVADIDGKDLTPMRPAGRAEVLFFITHDCPISNFYAPEIQRICTEYGGKSISCALVYVDPQLNIAAVRKH